MKFFYRQKKPVWSPRNYMFGGLDEPWNLHEDNPQHSSEDLGQGFLISQSASVHSEYSYHESAFPAVSFVIHSLDMYEPDGHSPIWPEPFEWSISCFVGLSSELEMNPLGILQANSDDCSPGRLGLLPMTFRGLSWWSKLIEGGKVASLSYSYTAGAPYRSNGTGVPGSLILGGYDETRATAPRISMPIHSGDLNLTILDLMYSPGTNFVSLMNETEIFNAIVDSETPFISLPKLICDQLQESLQLNYDPITKMYWVDDTANDENARSNVTVKFVLGTGVDGEHTSIEVPYAAFDMRARYAWEDDNDNDDDSSSRRYFPIKQSQAHEYILGSVFLQEAYLTVDYERNNFSIAPAFFADPMPNPRLVPIQRRTDCIEGACEDLSRPLRNGPHAGWNTFGNVPLILAIIHHLLYLTMMLRTFLKRRRERKNLEAIYPMQTEMVQGVNDEECNNTPDFPVEPLISPNGCNIRAHYEVDDVSDGRAAPIEARNFLVDGRRPLAESMSPEILTDSSTDGSWEDDIFFERKPWSQEAFEKNETHTRNALEEALIIVKGLLLQELRAHASYGPMDAGETSTSSVSRSTASSIGGSLSSGLSSCTSNSQSGPRKRVRGGGREPSDPGSDEDGSGDDRPKKRDDRSSPNHLRKLRVKCPFYQRQPEKYPRASCRGEGFVDMAKLKDHIKRVHTQPLRCSRCWLEMKSEDKYSKHLQQEVACEKNPEPQDDRIRPRVLDRLDFKKSPYTKIKSVEEKWGLMYTVLFPNDSDIPSPFERPGMSRQLERLLTQALEEELTRELTPLLEPVMTRIKGRVPAIIESCRRKLMHMSLSLDDRKGFAPSFIPPDDGQSDIGLQTCDQRFGHSNQSTAGNCFENFSGFSAASGNFDQFHNELGFITATDDVRMAGQDTSVIDSHDAFGGFSSDMRAAADVFEDALDFFALEDEQNLFAPPGNSTDP